MSVINSANVQVGQSVTASNNITLNTDASGNLIINKGVFPTLTEISRITNSGLTSSDKVSFLQAGTGAVARTVQDKARESVSVLDFMTPNQVSSALNRTNDRDFSTAINTADVACAILGKRLFFPSALYRLESTAYAGHQANWVGEQGADGCTEFWFYGADGQNAINSTLPDSSEKSRCIISDIRVLDKRTTPTAGWGIYLSNVDNRTLVEGCFVGSFPTGQIYIGATTGAPDCIEVRNNWVYSDIPGAFGVYLYRIGNTATIDTLYADVTDGVAVFVDGTSLDSSAIAIRNIKHELTNAVYSTAYATVQVSGAYYGVLTIENVTQSTVSGVGAGCDVVSFLGTANGRARLSNITGGHQQVAGTAPYTVRALGTYPQTFNGPVINMQSGHNGRLFRQLGGRGTPEGNVNGSVGEMYQQLDTARIFQKVSGENTNSGWQGICTYIDTDITVDIPSIANGAQYSFDTVVAGLSATNFCLVSSVASATVLIYTAKVYGANTLKITIANLTGGAVDPASQTLRVRAFQ